MDLEEAIKTRRSIRKFSEQKISNEILEKIIEAGNYAPSHCNTQGWKFILVDDPAIKSRIFYAGGSPVIKNSPYGILVCYDVSTSDNFEYCDWIQSSSAAMQNMLLCLHNLGLGGCWVCHLPAKKTLKKILGIKSGYQPVAYLAFGYPLAAPASIPRRNQIDNIMSKNAFIWPAKKTPLKVYIKRLGKKIYFSLPSFVKKIIFPLVDKHIKKFQN